MDPAVYGFGCDCGQRVGVASKALCVSGGRDAFVTHTEAELIESMFHLHSSVLEKFLRPVIVYLFLILFLRLFGKRELAQLNPFDLVAEILKSMRALTEEVQSLKTQLEGLRA